MDSGIDSTESSTRSISDTCIDISNVQAEETQNLFSTNSQEDMNQNSSENCTKEPSSHSNLKSPKEMLPNLGDEMDNYVQSSVPDGKKDHPFPFPPFPFPNHISMSIDPSKWNPLNSLMKENKKNLDGLLDNTKPASIKLSKDVVPGLYLDFNLSKKQERLIFNRCKPTLEDSLPYFASNSWGKESSSPQSQSNSLALLPYENRDLERKYKCRFTRSLRIMKQIVSAANTKEKQLRMAARLNKVELAEQLLREGVNSKATDEKERSALHIAAAKGNAEIAKLLLQYGADPNQKDSIGNTALHLAACTNHIETVILLIKAGIDVKQADNQGYSPLHLAQTRLSLLQQDPNPSSQNLRSQLVQIVEMMQEYLKSSGHKEEAASLSAMVADLSLADESCPADSDIQQLLASLQELTLTKVKKN